MHDTCSCSVLHYYAAGRLTTIPATSQSVNALKFSKRERIHRITADIGSSTFQDYDLFSISEKLNCLFGGQKNTSIAAALTLEACQQGSSLDAEKERILINHPFIGIAHLADIYALGDSQTREVIVNFLVRRYQRGDIEEHDNALRQKMNLVAGFGSENEQQLLGNIVSESNIIKGDGDNLSSYLWRTLGLQHFGSGKAIDPEKEKSYLPVLEFITTKLQQGILHELLRDMGDESEDCFAWHHIFEIVSLLYCFDSSFHEPVRKFILGLIDVGEIDRVLWYFYGKYTSTEFEETVKHNMTSWFSVEQVVQSIILLGNVTYSSKEEAAELFHDFCGQNREKISTVLREMYDVNSGFTTELFYGYLNLEGAVSVYIDTESGQILGEL